MTQGVEELVLAVSNDIKDPLKGLRLDDAVRQKRLETAKRASKSHPDPVKEPGRRRGAAKEP